MMSLLVVAMVGEFDVWSSAEDEEEEVGLTLIAYFFSTCLPKMLLRDASVWLSSLLPLPCEIGGANVTCAF